MEALAAAAGDARTLQAALAGLPSAYSAWLLAEARSLSRQEAARDCPALPRRCGRGPAAHPGRSAAPRDRSDQPRGFSDHEQDNGARQSPPVRHDQRTAACCSEAADMAPFPARLHSSEFGRARERWSPGSADRGSPVLPDRRRQDRSLSGPRSLRDRAPPFGQPRFARGRAFRRHALHASAAHARSAAACRRSRLRARTRAESRQAPWVMADRDRPLGWRSRDAEQPWLCQKPQAKHGGFLAEQHRKGQGPAPAPLKSCPWCGSGFDRDSFRLHPTAAQPKRLDLYCQGVDCEFSNGDRLPICAVDEEIYRRLPAFLIATVDKFANVPWEGRSGAFFGHVSRQDSDGFYGAAEPSGGLPLGGEIRPIDLIIQDELHLISSGPLGTVAGLYETAFDLLASRIVDMKRYRRSSPRPLR